MDPPQHTPCTHHATTKTQPLSQIPTARLFDAAIALDIALSGANILHGIFGGCTLKALGCPRGSKDVDCSLFAGQLEIMELFVDRQGCTCDDSSQQLVNGCKYVRIGWSGKADSIDEVVVKLYPAKEDPG